MIPPLGRCRKKRRINYNWDKNQLRNSLAMSSASAWVLYALIFTPIIRMRMTVSNCISFLLLHIHWGKVRGLIIKPFGGTHLLFYSFFRSEVQTWLSWTLTSGFHQAAIMVSVGCILLWRHLGNDLLPSLFRVLEEITSLWLYNRGPQLLNGCEVEVTLSSRRPPTDSCHLALSIDPLKTLLQGNNSISRFYMT